MANGFEPRNYVDHTDDVDAAMFEDLEERIIDVVGVKRYSRKVRGISYVSKVTADEPAPAATFNREEWNLDKKYIPRFGDAFLTGHSWTQFAPTPGSLWFRRLTRLLGIPDARAVNIGVSGGTSFGPKGGFPSDGAAAHVSKDFIVQNQDYLVTAPGGGGFGASADNWTPWKSLMIGYIGFNDPGIAAYFGATDWEPLTKHALRAWITNMRAARRYTPQSSELIYTGDWTQYPSPLSMGDGPAIIGPSKLGYISFNLPDDYKGQPLGIHWLMDNNVVTQFNMNVYLNSVKIVDQYSTRAASTSRAPFAPANGANPGGGVQLPGVLRITNLTAADAGKQILLEYAAPADGYAMFSGVTFEVDAPIVLLQIPRLPASLGQSEPNNVTQVDRVNVIHREVIDEFPPHTVSYEELTVVNPLNADNGNFNGIADPHLAGKGNGVRAEMLYDLLCASDVSARPLLSASIE